ncbi:ATP-binding protein [Streptomyces sp. SS162]|uniref:ATP-binding protein n=1 Tax=Streptomyces sp. SS162 TaxID=3108484 RepID=UPI002F4201F7
MAETVVSLFKEPEDGGPQLAVVETPQQPSSWRRAGRRVRIIATDERTRAAGRATVRHGMYVVGGARIVTRRAWEGRTAARYERMMRAAEAAGNLEAAAEWEARGTAFRAARHKRRMELLAAPQEAARSAVVGVLTVQAGLLALGGAVSVSTGELGDVLVPTLFVLDVLHWAVVIATVVWGPLVTLGPWLALLGLWAVGRHQQAAPQWALPARQRSTGGEPITPSIVVKAFRDLGISALSKAIRAMGDAGASMLGPITLAGCGVEVDVTLPSGSSTDEVMKRRRKLAENLGRHEHEVHVSVAPAARTVRLWIADSGALDEPVPASPLVLDETLTADYKNGRAPWGLDLRGDAALVSLYQKHLLITGLSNQGKTASLRALALWLALDPSVEFRIGDLKGVGDWSMFAGLATTLIEGPTDDHVVAVTHMVEGVFEEMQRRLLAPKGTTFPPLVALVDEAQVAYGSGAIGEDKRPYGGAKATSRYFRAVKGIHDQGRAVNVTIWEGTQDPTNENLPKRSREGNHIRAALVLGTEAQAEMALGESPVKAGAAPHKLRQDLDKGQVVVSGSGLTLPPGQVFLNVRTHYVSDTEAEAIAERARERRAGRPQLAAVEDVQDVDPLADVLAVLGDAPRLRTQVVLQRLAEHNPREYEDWTHADLKRLLDDVGHGEYKTDGGRMHVSRERIVKALADRDDDREDQGEE